jgi:hypothetical protein
MNLAELHDYIRIPNKSPAFDPDWERHGYMDQAIELLVDIPGELPGKRYGRGGAQVNSQR